MRKAATEGDIRLRRGARIKKKKKDKTQSGALC